MWPFRHFKSRAKHPVIDLADQYFSNFDSNHAIEDCEFVVLDSELTSLNVRRGEIVSIGAIRIKRLCILLDDCFYSHVKTKRQTVTDGTFIHRITPQQIRSAPDPGIVIPAFVEFCSHSILVGHGLDIDLTFLNRSSEILLGSKLPHPYLDTMELTRVLRQKQILKYEGDPKQSRCFDLATISTANKLPIFRPHNALGDAIQTAYLFLFLIHYLRREGLSTFSDFYHAKAELPIGCMPAY